MAESSPPGPLYPRSFAPKKTRKPEEIFMSGFTAHVDLTVTNAMKRNKTMTR
jgi:hypothetical protein